MKNQHLVLLVFMLFAASILTGCNVNQEQQVDDAAQTVKQADQELKDVQAKYEKEWQQFKSEAEAKIDANEKKINEFKEEMKTTTTKFKAKYENQVLTLEQKNIELKKKLNEYKYEGKDRWEEFKLGFNKDVDIVGNAINDIFSKED